MNDLKFNISIYGKFDGQTLAEILDRSDVSQAEKLELVRKHARAERAQMMIAAIKTVLTKLKAFATSKKNIEVPIRTSRHA